MALMCAVDGCTSSSELDNARIFYRFPLDEQRCKKWVAVTRCPELWKKGPENLHKDHYICDLHFNTKDRTAQKLRTVPFPIPIVEKSLITSINDTENTQTKIKEEVVFVMDQDSNDPCISNSPSNSRPQIEESSSSIQKKGFKITSKQYLLAKRGKIKPLHGDGNISEELQQLINLQQRFQPIKYDSKRCAYGLKPFALNLYLACPKTYRVLRRTINLPTMKTLRKTDIGMNTSLSPSVLQCLKSKIRRFKQTDKYCTICIDKMPLKRFLYYFIKKDKIVGFENVNGNCSTKLATNAYVIMARGIYINWDQPLGYCLTAKDPDQTQELTKWLEDAIRKILNIGLKVVALVSSHKDVGLKLAALRNVTITKPYFYVNDQKVYYIFDVPQTLISLRNTLIKYDFNYHDDDGIAVTAHYESIVELFLINSEINNPLLEQLTKSHIYPNHSEKKDFKYVTEVFSKFVSKAFELECKQRTDWQNSSIKGTRKLAALISDICDVINSTAVHDAFTSEPHQMQKINNFLYFLQDIRIMNSREIDIAHKMKWIHALNISVRAIKDLSLDLSANGIPLLTHRFNKAALDKFIGAVSQKNNGCKPTAAQFCKYYRQVFMAELLKCPETTYRFDDLKEFLLMIDLINVILSKFQPGIAPKCLSIGAIDYRFELPTTDKLASVCAYMLKKCYEVHKCDTLSKYVHTNIRRQFSTDWREYERKNVSPYSAPDTFVEFIKEMNKCFDRFISSSWDDHIGNGLLKALNDIVFVDACLCFPIEYLRKLFVRFHIFNMIRYSNRHMRKKTFKLCTSCEDYLS